MKERTRLAARLMLAVSIGARTGAWFAKYVGVPEHLKKSFEKVSDIPVDVEPIDSFAEAIR